MKDVLEGIRFAGVDEVKQTNKQQMAEAVKGIEINVFKSRFEPWKKRLLGALHPRDRTWKVMDVKHISTVFFVNKCWVLGSPLTQPRCARARTSFLFVAE